MCYINDLCAVITPYDENRYNIMCEGERKITPCPKNSHTHTLCHYVPIMEGILVQSFSHVICFWCFFSLSWSLIVGCCPVLLFDKHLETKSNHQFCFTVWPLGESAVGLRCEPNLSKSKLSHRLLPVSPVQASQAWLLIDSMRAVRLWLAAMANGPWMAPLVAWGYHIAK